MPKPPPKPPTVIGPEFGPFELALMIIGGFCSLVCVAGFCWILTHG